MSADDVGGARITWRGRDRDRSVSLLIGSEPERAPRQVNEWGYIREDAAGDSTTVFAIRTPNWWFKVELQLDEEGDVPPDPAGDTSVSQRIAALCAPRAE